VECGYGQQSAKLCVANAAIFVLPKIGMHHINTLVALVLAVPVMSLQRSVRQARHAAG